MRFSHNKQTTLKQTVFGTICLAGAALIAVTMAKARQLPPVVQPVPLVTGKYITPTGEQTNIGSFPVNSVVTPDGKYFVVTDVGARSFVTVLNRADGTLVSQISFENTSGGRGNASVYYGLAFGKAGEDGSLPLYVSRGGEESISVLSLSPSGILTNTGTTIPNPVASAAKPFEHFVAGLAVSASGDRIYAANNSGDPKRGMNSTISILTKGATGFATVDTAVPGYPFAVVAVTKGANADKKLYVGSEQRGNISVLDAANGKTITTIKVGTNPTGLLLSDNQTRLFVANSNSETVSVIDTNSDKVIATIPMLPSEARGLSGATPTGLALSPDEKTLYVTLSDMNAVAVVDVNGHRVSGYIPVGWYPTSVVVSTDGKRLFVTNAKGTDVRIPNDKPVAVAKERPTYIENIIEGTVSSVTLPDADTLKKLTQQTLGNNLLNTARTKLTNPGIEHIVYIIKENRTYDQVLGDLPTGNGDKSLVMFGRDITPNQHALAERFVLLDNFYCSAEVSGDGWNWTTAGMANENVARNVVHRYTGHPRQYDYEGTNNGVAIELQDIPNVARPTGGYIWEAVAKKGLTYRDYGFYVDDLEEPRRTPEEGSKGRDDQALQKSLIGKTCAEFRPYDTRFPDSEAFKFLNLKPAPGQRLAHGKYKDPSRLTAWKREFAAFVTNGNFPRFNMVRLGRDHTAGTSPGQNSPRAMVADNDYAVGQVVEAISHSPYWTKTAIIVLEDDAQAGQDHVDAHRSIAFVISPYIRTGLVDSRFYNSDSALRTIESLLGLPPMNQYDAGAPPLAVFTDKPINNAPYTAILPDKAIVGEVNTPRAYRANDSLRLFANDKADSTDVHVDAARNDILWHAVKGAKTPMPAPKYGLTRNRR